MPQYMGGVITNDSGQVMYLNPEQYQVYLLWEAEQHQTGHAGSGIGRDALHELYGGPREREVADDSDTAKIGSSFDGIAYCLSHQDK